ncbi:MAG: hypothetical protein CL792_02640 [Chloroflexi bacterium]|nr:hypothetical protein [Chloroflexota bacterium]
MHDGITLEKLNVPALTLCTYPFQPTAEATAKTLGLPNFRFALIDHPIGSRSEQELRERAQEAYVQGSKILLGN